MTTAGDEKRQGGEEAWSFDAFDVARGLGVVVRLALRASERVAWWWAGAVGVGPPLVALRADDVPVPARGTTVRTDGLWASLTCEEPLVHWSVAMECFGVAYDDPWEAARSERGDVVPFGLELSFVASAPAVASSGTGYGQWCSVSGEVLLGDARVAVDAIGHREHAWGAAAPLPARRARVWGALPGASLETVAVCPFLVPGGVWVESLCRAVGGSGGAGGWVGAPLSASGSLPS